MPALNRDADTAALDLFTTLSRFAAEAPVVIDRPAGTRHPRHPSVIYPVDYGHIPGTVGSDGDGIDVFVGSARGRGVVAIGVTADPVKRDAEIKVLLECTPDEIEAVHVLLRDTLGIGGVIVHNPRSAAADHGGSHG